MAVESAADRAALLSVSEFGVTATIGVTSFPGILDAEYVEASGIGTTHPVLHCDTAVAAAAGAARDVNLVIAGVTYAIRDLQADGTGMTLLILERQ